MTQPSAALDQILAHTHHLLLDFDGPICDFYPDHSGRAVADQLRKHLHDQHVPAPDVIMHTHSPIEVFTYAATISPDLAASTEAELTALEVTAATSAAPNAYVPDLLVACQDSARTVTVVSNISTPAVHAYLARHDLDNLVVHVIARTSPAPNLLKPSPHLIEQALTTLKANPTICTMLGDSPTDIESAHQAGIASIGYANRHGKHELFTTAGAGAIIISLTDLVLRLRGRDTSCS
jgi:phosphoglycolate phosphatase